MKIHGLLLPLPFFLSPLVAQEDRYAQITNPKLTEVSTKSRPAAPSPLTRTRRMPLSTTARTEHSASPSTASGNSTMWRTSPTAPPDFMDIHADVSKWPDIDVPGNWELQGFGTPVYVNQPYEFCSPGHAPYWDKPNPPYVPKEWNPTGTYRRTFTLPCRLGQQRNLPERRRSARAAFYYLNGKFAGMSKDSKTPARFNVTSLCPQRRERDCHTGAPLLRRQLSGVPGLLAHQRHRTGHLHVCPAANTPDGLQGGDSPGRRLP